MTHSFPTRRSSDLAIDPALRRPGRFDREIEIKVPDKKGRKDILAIHSRNMPLSDDVNVEKISSISHGYVEADLEYLCKEAAMKRSEEHTSELQSLMRTSYAVSCLKKKKNTR